VSQRDVPERWENALHPVRHREKLPQISPTSVCSAWRSGRTSAARHLEREPAGKERRRGDGCQQVFFCPQGPGRPWSAHPGAHQLDRLTAPMYATQDTHTAKLLHNSPQIRAPAWSRTDAQDDWPESKPLLLPGSGCPGRRLPALLPSSLPTQRELSIYQCTDDGAGTQQK